MSNLWTDMYADRNEVLVYIHAVMLYKFHLSVARKNCCKNIVIENVREITNIMTK